MSLSIRGRAICTPLPEERRHGRKVSLGIYTVPDVYSEAHLNDFKFTLLQMYASSCLCACKWLYVAVNCDFSIRSKDYR